MAGWHLLNLASPALSTIASPSDDDHFGPAEPAVQAGRCQEWIQEQVGPFVGGPVAGEQDTAALVAFVDHIIQVFRASWLVWF